MLKQLRTFLAPPIFPDDEDKTRRARYSHVIALAFFGLAVVYETAVRILVGYSSLTFFDLVLVGVAVICIVGLDLLRRGYVRFTSFLLVALVWLACNGVAATSFGVRDVSYIINFAIVLMAGLLLGWQAAWITTVLSIAAGIALAYAEQNGLIVTNTYSITSFTRDMALVFGLNGILIYLLINGLENALGRSRVHLAEAEAANASLSQAQAELQSRSAELLVANQQLGHRTSRLQAIAMVARSAAGVQSFDALLKALAGIISKQLGYYHVGVFLLDEQKEFAILRSSNTEAGQKLLQNDYRIPVRQSKLIGFVMRTGQPHLIQSFEDHSVFLHSLELPQSQSELLLPLKVGEQVIGILDIHSAELGDFSQDDVAILSILGDQVAITLQNLLLYEESQNAWRRATSSSAQSSTEAWKHYKKAIEIKGYRYDGIKSEPLRAARPSGNGMNALSVPIQLRGQTIGSFNLKPSDPARTWTDDELMMVRSTAERVALALEGARLLEEAQKRANREAFLSDISTKLSASFQLDSILRDTVQELGHTIRNSTVTFQLVNPAKPAIASAETPDDYPADRVGHGGRDE